MKEGRPPGGGTLWRKAVWIKQEQLNRIALCFPIIISPLALTTTTLGSLGSFQIWQHLLDPETTAISYSETVHLESNCIFARMQKLRSMHMPQAWIMAHSKQVKWFGGLLLVLCANEQTYMLLGLFHLETWRWKFGCLRAINVTKFNLSSVLRPDCGLESKIRGSFKDLQFLRSSQWLLFGNDVLDQKTVVLLHRKLLLLSIIGVGIAW